MMKPTPAMMNLKGVLEQPVTSGTQWTPNPIEAAMAALLLEIADLLVDLEGEKVRWCEKHNAPVYRQAGYCVAWTNETVGFCVMVWRLLIPIPDPVVPE